ncbi:MAG TPA: hypothetical protein VKA46_29785 [Gemmataceae bacterium]|nr:hypothetical protein [Gemmataceae bacterium]
MLYPIRKSGRSPRRGIALVAVLIVIAVLALAAYRFSDLMTAEAQAADSYTRSVKAHGFADSGVNYFAALIASDPTGQNGLLGNPFSNTSMFQGIQLGDDSNPRQRGRFSIVSPLDPDTATSGSGSGGQAFRYGVIDESSKININALFKLDSSGQTLYNTLMQLPNMTDDVANSIVFWVDPSATPRSSGATDQDYMAMTPSYHAKNAPLDSIEELLYVRGVTPQLLFGNDTKRNGQADPSAGDGTGTLDLGWFPYLTMYSREMNVSSQGNPRIWVNDPNLQALATNLTNAGFDDTISAFILAYRMYGAANASSGSGSGGNSSGTMGGMTSTTTTTTAGGGTTILSTITAKPTTGSSTAKSGSGNSGSTQPLTTAALGNLQTQGGGKTISSLYALVNAQVTIPASSPQDQATTYTSPMTDSSSIKQYLPQVLDQLTTSQSPNLPARININTAPNAVLSALSTGSSSASTPILDPGTVQMILSTRPPLDATGAPDAIFQTPAWLITEANLPVATVQQLDQYITARSQVYRIQSLGHFDGGGPTARVEAVIDFNGGRPRVVYYRDLTSLGKGFDLPKNP